MREEASRALLDTPVDLAEVPDTPVGLSVINPPETDIPSPLMIAEATPSRAEDEASTAIG